jgi:hypothetical protein
MKRALYGFVSLGLGLLSQSCVEDTSAVYAAAVVSPDDECIIADDAEIISLPSYDPRTGLGYVASIRVENQLINRQTDIAADPMGVHITDADVTLSAIDGSPLNIGAPNPFRIPATGYIPSSDDGTPSLGLANLVPIPPSIATSAAGAPGGVIVVEVVLIGHTTGTLDIETEPFTFAVYLQNLCTTVPGDATTCRPGQDGGRWFPGTGVACN